MTPNNLSTQLKVGISLVTHSFHKWKLWLCLWLEMSGAGVALPKLSILHPSCSQCRIFASLSAGNFHIFSTSNMSYYKQQKIVKKHTGNLNKTLDDLCSSGNVLFTADFTNDPKHLIIWQLQPHTDHYIISCTTTVDYHFKWQNKVLNTIILEKCGIYGTKAIVFRNQFCVCLSHDRARIPPKNHYTANYQMPNKKHRRTKTSCMSTSQAVTLITRERKIW